MSLLSQLKVLSGSTQSNKRLGRGNGSGTGGTSGKGHKGQRARTGGRVRWGFEGGQTPLHRRLPKFGFNPLSPVDYQVINLSQLEKMSGVITPETLHKANLSKKNDLIKILSVGKLSKAVTVKAHAFSAKAKASIEAAGGTAEVIK